ncbi:hypothetical protein [Actinoplanes couchii]|uniref:Uncharacterized protein n=1 Tax=Actinoplanes couchii TaxID=403638 RepID=A0ABQ3XGF4_9ACTN|nr:hypothetical protein [Actinoplanes couchii]MDR6321082.1 hypothetical protein [Actinoplanes couchii]GID57593.1 hypothetical protein Aco03nite_059970 [Actinoplanes couchii]
MVTTVALSLRTPPGTPARPILSTAEAAPVQSTGRPFLASVSPGRDLDDVDFNRLFEYADNGPRSR